MEWDMDKLDELSLWGSPQEDEIDFEEELAKERARRRKRVSDHLLHPGSLTTLTCLPCWT